MLKINFKKRFYILLGALILIRLSFILLNYVVDPFEVFQSGFLKNPLAFNLRYDKYEYLKDNHSKYNSYLLGSSRVGQIRPKEIEKYIPGSRFYNLSVPGANWYDHLSAIEYLLKNGAQIRNIFLLVDYDLRGFLAHNDSLELRSHPEISEQPNFYLDYLMSISLRHFVNKFRNVFVDTYVSLDVPTGVIQYEMMESRLNNDPDKYFSETERIFKVSKIKRADAEKFNKAFLEQELKQLQLFFEVCKVIGVKPIVAVSPNHYSKLNSYNAYNYSMFLMELADSTDFWDFNGYNSVTMDNKYYYDTSHFRPVVGELMMKKIFNNETALRDFGKYINKGNVINHAEKERWNFKMSNRLINEFKQMQPRDFQRNIK